MGIVRRRKIIWIIFFRTLLISATILAYYFVNQILPLVQACFIDLILAYIILISVTIVRSILTVALCIFWLTFQSILLFKEHLELVRTTRFLVSVVLTVELLSLRLIIPLSLTTRHILMYIGLIYHVAWSFVYVRSEFFF
jgi:hypothetical protein